MNLLTPFRKSQQKTCISIVSAILEAAEANSFAVASKLVSQSEIGLASAVNRFYRFLRNERFDNWLLTERLFAFFAERKRIILCLDWMSWGQQFSLLTASVCVEKGARLEIRAGMKHYETILQKSGSKTFSLPEGLPESIWIALTRGDSWLDYRKVDLRSGYLLPEEKVTQEPKDKPTELKGIIARGESETTEFKEEIPDRIEKLTKSVAAFANGKGGVIIVSVNDDAVIVGIKADIHKENLPLNAANSKQRTAAADYPD